MTCRSYFGLGLLAVASCGVMQAAIAAAQERPHNNSLVQQPPARETGNTEREAGERKVGGRPSDRGPDVRRPDARPADGRRPDGRPPEGSGPDMHHFGGRPNANEPFETPRRPDGGDGRFGRGGGLGFDPELLRRADPEMYELEMADQEMDRRALDISQQFARSRGEQRDAIKKELAEAVNQHFEVRQKRRALMLERMEQELSRMRDELTKRNALREQIVNRRLNELSGARNELDF